MGLQVRMVRRRRIKGIDDLQRLFVYILGARRRVDEPRSNSAQAAPATSGVVRRSKRPGQRQPQKGRRGHE